MTLEKLQEKLGENYIITYGRGTYFVKIYDSRSLHLIAEIKPDIVHVDPYGLDKEQYNSILEFVKTYF